MHLHLYLVVLLISGLLFGCGKTTQTPPEIELAPTEQELLLNGTWKFNTFLGDGSNYRDVTPSAQDIVVDNQDSQFLQINGKWNTNIKGERGSKHWGEDYLKRVYSELNPDINVKFFYPEFKAGYYEHFVYYPWGITLHAEYKIKHNGGLTSKFISQRNRPGQWISLGIYQIEHSAKPYIEVNTINTGKSVVADAVMLRPVNKQDYLFALEQKQQAFLNTSSDTNWFDLKVPGHWGMINQYSTYTGKGWYRKSFQTPKNWTNSADQQIRLAFDGVYHYAKVYLNGEYLGQHQGGFTPFEFDVTNKLNLSGDNLIAVEADNSAIVGATWNWGGIIRDVKLVKTADVRINYQYIHSEPDLTNGTAALNLKVRVQNNSSKQRYLTFNSKVLKELELTQFSHDFTVAANATAEFELTGNLTKQQVELWHFDRPNLYQLQSQISENGIAIHDKQDRFGIRKIEITDTTMLLNGEPVRIGGYNRISDHRYWGSSEPLELLEQDIELMKNSGANFMRIMHGTQNKALIELCDEKGILIFEEANIRELTNPEFVAPEYKVNKQWLKEMVERDINHPSIIGWSVGNELKDHYQYVDKMITYVKEELDPHRLVTNVSNTGYRKSDTPETDPLGLSDLMMQNIYQKDAENVVTTIADRWPNKPLFLSEYGLGRFTTPSLDHDYPNFADWHSMIRGRNTHVIGTSLWSFNDYRSGYAETLEEENRAWGIVNNWRQKRRGYQTFQKELSAVKSLSLTNMDPVKGMSGVLLNVRDTNDYPSYTMQGYSLEWQLRDINSKVIQQNTLALPTLTPQSETWQGQINWDAKQPNIHDLVVTVKSTNGYIRYEVISDFKVPAQPTIKGVISSDDTVRVLFDKAPSGKEYFVRYTNVAGEVFNTPKTIDSYIDLMNLTKQQTVNIELITSNQKGDSQSSVAQTVKLTGASLPPVIWKVMLRDNKLILGFSGETDDKSYVVKYGYSADTLDYTASTSSRGMLTANIDPQAKSVFYQLKRISSAGESQWSLLIEVHKRP